MIKVDAIYGIDTNEEVDNYYYSDIPLKTLTKAIEVSKSGDVISLMPGTHEPFNIRAKTSHFELKIIGCGNNTICSQSAFEGFFDISYENLKIDTCYIISSSSNFNFKDVKFVSMNTMHLEAYHENKSEDPRTHIVFDRCKFDHNFQIIIKNGNYVLSFKSCEIKGRIPLVYAKRGDITIKVSNTDFENPILLNVDCVAEIQHTCCNFTCPIYNGKETLIYTKDNIMGSSPPFERTRSSSNYDKGGYDENTEIIPINEDQLKTNKKKNIEYLRELYGAIMVNSDELEELPLHRYTKLVVNQGNTPLTIKLPKETDNGHIITIYSYGPLIIGENTYKPGYVRLGWIYPNGWWLFPTETI